MKNKFNITTNDDSAIITHYLQNKDSDFAFPFEQDALQLLSEETFAL